MTTIMEKGTGPIAGLWTKFEGNPILGGERLGTCFDVNVVRDGPAPWTMYFSWRPRKAIALVRSGDGTSRMLTRNDFYIEQ